MKPKDLKPPFKKDSKEVFLDLSEGVLYIPERVERKNLKEEIKKYFSSFNCIHLEFCSGNGEWLHKKALEHPEILWIGVEKQFKRVRKIWSKAKNSELKNIFIVSGEALEFSENYLYDDCIDQIYINFPDPWPKNKHAKFRLIQSHFTAQMSRILKEGGHVNFLTDDFNYSKQAISVLLTEKSFLTEFDHPHYHSDLGDYGSSYFRRLWEEKKRSFYFSKFQKTCKY